MTFRSWCTYTALCCTTLILVACGGSGGGGDSTDLEPTPTQPSLSELIARDPSTVNENELQDTYKDYALELYSAETALSEVSVGAVQEFAGIFLGDDSLSPPLPPSEVWDIPNSASGTNLESIDTVIQCYESGWVEVKGSLAADGSGNLAVTYVDCQHYSGWEIANGRGAITLSESGESGALYYDQVTVQLGDSTTEVSGFYSFAQNLSGSSLTYNVNLLSKDLATGKQRLEQSTRQYSSSGSDINGDFYVSGHGKMAITTERSLNGTYAPTVGELLFSGLNNHAATLEFVDSSLTKFLLDNSGDGIDDLGYYFGSVSSFLVADLSDLELLPLSELGFAPQADPPVLTTENPTTIDELVVQPGYYWDRDTPTEQLSIFYIWTINDVRLDAEVGDSLGERVAKKDDEVQVRMVVSDGKFSTTSEPLTFIIGDAPASVAISGEIPESLQAGQTLSFSALYSDPDIDDGAVPANLIYGPPGMSIDGTGLVHWVASSTLFDSSTIHFGLGFSEGEENQVLDYSVEVASSEVAPPIARSGLEVPNTNYALHVADFNGDADNEILGIDSFNRIFAIRAQDGGYQQAWLYPYGLASEGQIKAIAPFDVDPDEKQEILIASEHGLSVIDDDRSRSRELWSTEQYIRAMAVADSDLDGTAEVALIVSGDAYSSGNDVKLIVIELSESLPKLFETSLVGGSNELVFGNVDEDAQLELVVNSGYVFDGAEWSNQWFYGLPFGDGHIATGDLDGDGVAEIVAADTWDSISVYSGTLKSKLYAQDNFNTCSVITANVDDDPEMEALVGDCQWGNVTAYDWQSSALQQQWQLDMQGHGSKSLVVGDSDNDGELEVIWGTGQSSSGKDALIVADVTPTPAIVWGEDATPQLDVFSAAGWGDLSPGEEVAVFIVPSTNSGYDGQRLVYMQGDGNSLVSDELHRTWEGGMYGKVTDFNQDGFADIFLASSELYDGIFEALQLNDFYLHWSFGGTYDNNIGMVDALDLNGDEIQDAIYVDGKTVTLMDIGNQQLIGTLYAADFVGDIGVRTLADGSPQVAVASNSKLEIWGEAGTIFAVKAEASISCVRVAFGNFDSDAELELICAENTGYYASETAVVVYELGGESLEEINRFVITGKLTDFVTDTTTDANQRLLAAVTVSDSSGNGANHIQSYSPQLGALLWSSPSLLGPISHRSIHFRPEVAGDKARLMFATTKAMYQVQ